MLPSECFPTMLAMQFSYIPVMSILVIWALIQLVLPPYHSDGRLKEPISPYALLRSGILRDDQIVDCSYLTFGTFCGCFCNISIPFFLSFFLSLFIVFVFYFFPLWLQICASSVLKERCLSWKIVSSFDCLHLSPMLEAVFTKSSRWILSLYSEYVWVQRQGFWSERKCCVLGRVLASNIKNLSFCLKLWISYSQCFWVHFSIKFFFVILINLFAWLLLLV